MSIFESELKGGRLVIPECPRCQKIAWPPSESCARCFGSTVWRTVIGSGILIEHSAKDGKTFCIAEFENAFRIMGTLECDSAPIPGQKLKVSSCGFDDSPRFTFAPE